MPRPLILFCVAAAAAAPGPRDPRLAESFRARLQQVIDAGSRLHNVSWSLAVRSDAVGSVDLVAGLNDRSRGQETHVARRGRFPMGSVTKSWTAAAVMRMRDAGRIDIDAPIALYVDPIMWRLNRTTMRRLFDDDPRVDNITVRHVMHMRSGIHDYDDHWVRNWTLTHRGSDWSPFDDLHRLNHNLTCDPGTCGTYSGTSYELLGFALCQTTPSCQSWEDLDLMSLCMPAELRKTYSGVAFAGKGPCYAVPDDVHQYRLAASKTGGSSSDDPMNVLFSDIIDDSCLNGWTMGDIVATPGDVAQWYWDMFHDKVVKHSTLVEMLDRVPLTNGWRPGLPYGLGLMTQHVKEDEFNLTWTLGHGGQDWGSNAALNGFNSRFGFSISLASNSVSGMNCSDTYRAVYPISPGVMYNDVYYKDMVCVVYDEVLQVLTNATVPRIRCAARSGQAAPHGGWAVPPPAVEASARRGATANFSCTWDF